jgi:hypothetical protein
MPHKERIASFVPGEAGRSDQSEHTLRTMELNVDALEERIAPARFYVLLDQEPEHG